MTVTHTTAATKRAKNVDFISPGCCSTECDDELVNRPPLYAAAADVKRQRVVSGGFTERFATKFKPTPPRERWQRALLEESKSVSW